MRKFSGAVQQVKDMGKLKRISSGTDSCKAFHPRDSARSSFTGHRPDNTEALRCPFLDEVKSYCTVDARAYIPNQFELRRYCKRPDHKKCRFYLDLCVWAFLNSEPF